MAMHTRPLAQSFPVTRLALCSTRIRARVVHLYWPVAVSSGMRDPTAMAAVPALVHASPVFSRVAQVPAAPQARLSWQSASFEQAAPRLPRTSQRPGQVPLDAQ